MIAVLGMHRSGTSSLAGSLEEAGVALGDVVTYDPYNPKGSREDRHLWAVHDNILAANGSTWRSPADVLRWDDGHRAQRDAIIRSHRRRPVWGFKDPRTVLLVDFWREAIPHLEFVGTFRHPSAVVASLLERNGRTPELWLRLWEIHNRKLVDLHKADPFPIIDFDAPAREYRRALETALNELHLAGPPGAFFDVSLRHHEFDDEELPDRVDALYRELREIAI